MHNSFFDGKNLIKLDKRYKYHYSELSKLTKLKTHTLFLLCVICGYKNGKKSNDYETGGAEFRPSYFKTDQQSIIYGIAYNEYGEELYKRLEDEEFQKELRKTLILYSNGGMEILIEEVFKDNMVDGSFMNSYTDYDTDLLKYIYGSLKSVPF